MLPLKKFARKIEKLEFSARLPASAAVGQVGREFLQASTTKVHAELAPPWRSRAKQSSLASHDNPLRLGNFLQLPTATTTPHHTTPRRNQYRSHERQATARRGCLRWRCETGALQQWLARASTVRRGAQEGRGHGQDRCYEGQNGCWEIEWSTVSACSGTPTATGSGISSSSQSTSSQRYGRSSCEKGRYDEEAGRGKGEDRSRQRCIRIAGYGRNGCASAHAAGPGE